MVTVLLIRKQASSSNLVLKRLHERWLEILPVKSFRDMLRQGGRAAAVMEEGMAALADNFSYGKSFKRQVDDLEKFNHAESRCDPYQRTTIVPDRTR